MPKDQDPLDPTPDPSEDTPDEDTEDTAEADADAQSDWTPKDRTEAMRKITELATRNRELERAAAEPEPAADDADEGDASDDSGYLDDQNALLAAELYGEEVTKAAETVWDLLESATTTADWMTVLETYHQNRSTGASAPEAAAAGGSTNGAGRQQAVQPRVDSNRSDRGPDSDDKLAEAKKSGKLENFASAAIDSWFGGKKG